MRISYTKGRCDSVIDQSRLSGTAEWTTVGHPSDTVTIFVGS